MFYIFFFYALYCFFFFFFFFSSRRRHTRCSRDWSSDVCSSDLIHRYFVEGMRCVNLIPAGRLRLLQYRQERPAVELRLLQGPGEVEYRRRSEERRVGKECRSRWWTYQ